MKTTLRELRQIVRTALKEWALGDEKNLMLDKKSKVSDPSIGIAVKKWLKAMKMIK